LMDSREPSKSIQISISIIIIPPIISPNHPC
jgi:hypothetical protein